MGHFDPFCRIPAIGGEPIEGVRGPSLARTLTAGPLGVADYVVSDGSALVADPIVSPGSFAITFASCATSASRQVDKHSWRGANLQSHNCHSGTILLARRRWSLAVPF